MKEPQQPPGPKPPLCKPTSRKLGDFSQSQNIGWGFQLAFELMVLSSFAFEHVNQLLHMKLGIKAVLPKNKFKVYFWRLTGSGQEKNQQKSLAVTPAGNCTV